MKLNKKLLLMKSHYLLFLGGLAPLFPFLPVYANTKLSISYLGVGLIYTILPFLGLLSQLCFGMIADWLRVHRTLLLTCIIISSLGFSSTYFASPLLTNSNSIFAPIKFGCNPNSSYLRYDAPKKKCGAQDFLKGIQEIESASCEVICPEKSNSTETFCTYWNVPIKDCKKDQKFSTSVLVGHAKHNSSSTVFPINVIYMESQDANSTYKVDNLICEEETISNCSVRCDNEPFMEYLGAPTSHSFLSTYTEILSQYQFWIFFLCLAVGNAGTVVVSVMADTVCYQLLKGTQATFGRQRLFGAIGWGASVIFTGFLIDLFSEGPNQKNYAPAYIFSLCIMILDFIVASSIKIKVEQKPEETKASNVVGAISKPHVLLFIFCCALVGATFNILWTFQLILVEEVAYAYDCNFAHMKLLQGLIMGVQCLVGELPFFFISGAFINKIGHLLSMTIVIAGMGTGFVLYYFVRNPWVFLSIESLNGFAFGIAYPALTSYASVIAPPGAEATLQGIFGAAFFGIGMATGAFTGGAVYSAVGGPLTFLYIGIGNLIISFLCTMVHIYLVKSNRIPKESPS